MAGTGGGAGGIDAMLSMTTPLGPDMLHPVGLTARESISAPFEFTVTMVSSESSIDADRLLYQPVCVTVHRPPASDRHFHGMVRHFAATGLPVRGQWSYQAEVVPKLWFMGQTADCRIFQNVTTFEILNNLLAEIGVAVTKRIYGEEPVLDYVTQYNETDLDFATRLMEEAGYYYFFEHTESAHTLTVADRNQAFRSLALPEHYVVHAGGNAEVFNAWSKAAMTAHGAVTLLDYDPENPTTLPKGNTKTTLKTAGASSRDIFRWPALTARGQVATDRSRLRIEAAEAAAALFEGGGADQAMVPGAKFTIARDPFTQAAGTEYVVRGVVHTASDETWVGGGGVPSYANSFTAFPSATIWRQPLVTPRPVMAGIHAAIVLGNDGEGIHSERLARVKVRFFWDHRQDMTASTVCWVRILQPWGGNTWGWQHLPRVGTEVGIAFMDGDPDRPVMVGCFYNDHMKPVFAVPDEQTKSGIRTRSTLGGSTSTFSEFSFDDKMGSELVFLHAEKDLTTEVEHDQTLKVDNCRIVTVKQDETVDIGNKQTITVKADRTVKISQGNDKLTVAMGNLAVAASLGKIEVEAMQSIELKVGQSSIKLDPMGVTIQAMTIKITGQLETDVSGAITKVSGSGMLMLKGGIMMLN